MNLMICATASRLAPPIANDNIAVDILSYAIAETGLGRILVARSIKGVCAILIGADDDALQADLASRFPQAKLVANDAFVRSDLAEVIRFVDEPANGLRLTLDMRGTPLQRRIWEKMRAIPVSKTIGCLELARWVGPLTSARVIDRACAANPIALAIPCHHVNRGDGELVRGRWDVKRKRELLVREQRSEISQPVRERDPQNAIAASNAIIASAATRQ